MVIRTCKSLWSLQLHNLFSSARQVSHDQGTMTSAACKCGISVTRAPAGYLSPLQAPRNPTRFGSILSPYSDILFGLRIIWHFPQFPSLIVSLPSVCLCPPLSLSLPLPHSLTQDQFSLLSFLSFLPLSLSLRSGETDAAGSVWEVCQREPWGP